MRKYLKQSEPKRVESCSRARPVLEAVAPRIEALLEQWLPWTTSKQRITGSRLHQQLVEEGFTVGVSTLRAYLREKRRQASEVYIPLVHRPGDSAQVDFFEVTVSEAGQQRKAWKLLVRLMASGRDFPWLYDRCDQVSFLDAHVRAFAYFDGVPRRMVCSARGTSTHLLIWLQIGQSRRRVYRRFAFLHGISTVWAFAFTNSSPREQSESPRTTWQLSTELFIRHRYSSMLKTMWKHRTS